ncbi:MAG: hypothetical protein DMG99_07485, partial [Acidobacteria bacterium]
DMLRLAILGSLPNCPRSRLAEILVGTGSVPLPAVRANKYERFALQFDFSRVIYVSALSTANLD